MTVERLTTVWQPLGVLVLDQVPVHEFRPGDESRPHLQWLGRQACMNPDLPHHDAYWRVDQPMVHLALMAAGSTTVGSLECLQELPGQPEILRWSLQVREHVQRGNWPTRAFHEVQCAAHRGTQEELSVGEQIRALRVPRSRHKPEGRHSPVQAEAWLSRASQVRRGVATSEEALHARGCAVGSLWIHRQLILVLVQQTLCLQKQFPVEGKTCFGIVNKAPAEACPLRVPIAIQQIP
mmetsp:Transcript_72298/g.233944  ORF Transcript_72298/g.233944 Transcript_72298/m.233944 type:complete len:237 (+) Transcript_72298:1325-2035(+)